MTSPLISVEELSADLGSYLVLDVRWRLTGPSGEGEYGAGHIPGARYVDLPSVLAGPPGAAGRHPLPDPQAFEAGMRAVGVSSGSRVVAYDDFGSAAAARLWWLLRHHGHRQVQVLDGGWSAWRDAGLAVSTEPPAAERGDFTARPGELAVVSADGAAVLASTGVLLDARAGERYRGEVEPIDPVAGHIPGAVSAPAAENVDAAGRFLPADALRERFATLGVTPDVPVGAYCGSGVTAAQELLALEVAGFAGALYAGSWSEWVADGSRPVATGG
ncbi:MAG: thiosulfate/3-mercaptopyruvate sulfurtransferase [Frankiaceae bacterium]|nr:thiosulfate/3-mercaptopyruvate sulfurtransferase [Frankiaceae bacterium]MDX6273784.1 thiosulfate/3-mercaptopyruvate sulfurtransferase [Frankiales bacterium]